MSERYKIMTAEEIACLGAAQACGFWARSEGHGVCACPYDCDDNRAEHWLEGWENADYCAMAEEQRRYRVTCLASTE